MQLPLPALRPGDVLLRLRCAGICGTDLWKLRQHTVAAGAVLGHEVVGVVERIAPPEEGGDGAGSGDGGLGGVDGVGAENAYAPGDRVVAVHHVPCGSCHFCRAGSPTMCPQFRHNILAPGGFSERLVVRGGAVAGDDRRGGGGLFRLPAHLADEAAVFLEPVACVLRGLCRGGWETALRFVAAWGDAASPTGAAAMEAGGKGGGDSDSGGGQPVAAILGAGSMGLLHLLVLQALAHAVPGAAAPRVAVSDPVASRRALALGLGAGAAAAPGEELAGSVEALSAGRGADLVIDTAGGAVALDEGLRLCRAGGAVVLFAHAAGQYEPAAFPLNAFFKNELRVVATYSSAPAEQRAALALLAGGHLDPRPLVTHRLRLTSGSDVEAAVALASSPQALKVLFTVAPPGDLAVAAAADLTVEASDDIAADIAAAALDEASKTGGMDADAESRT